MLNEYLSQGTVQSHLYGIDNFILTGLEVFDGEIDVNKFKTGNYVIVSAYDSSGKIPYYRVGDKITIDFGNQKSKQYKVMAIAGIPFNLSLG